MKNTFFENITNQKYINSCRRISGGKDDVVPITSRDEPTVMELKGTKNRCCCCDYQLGNDTDISPRNKVPNDILVLRNCDDCHDYELNKCESPVAIKHPPVPPAIIETIMQNQEKENRRKKGRPREALKKINRNTGGKAPCYCQLCGREIHPNAKSAINGICEPCSKKITNIVNNYLEPNGNNEQNDLNQNGGTLQGGGLQQVPSFSIVVLQEQENSSLVEQLTQAINRGQCNPTRQSRGDAFGRDQMADFNSRRQSNTSSKYKGNVYDSRQPMPPAMYNRPPPAQMFPMNSMMMRNPNDMPMMMPCSAATCPDKKANEPTQNSKGGNAASGEDGENAACTCDCKRCRSDANKDNNITSLLIEALQIFVKQAKATRPVPGRPPLVPGSAPRPFPSRRDSNQNEKLLNNSNPQTITTNLSKSSLGDEQSDRRNSMRGTCFICPCCNYKCNGGNKGGEGGKKKRSKAKKNETDKNSDTKKLPKEKEDREKRKGRQPTPIETPKSSTRRNDKENEKTGNERGGKRRTESGGGNNCGCMGRNRGGDNNNGPKMKYPSLHNVMFPTNALSPIAHYRPGMITCPVNYLLAGNAAKKRLVRTAAGITTYQKPYNPLDVTHRLGATLNSYPSTHSSPKSNVKSN